MENRKVNLRIYGMTCDDCVRTISESLKEQPGVIDVKISLKDGTGEVKIDPALTKEEEILRNRIFSKDSHYKTILVQ
ncbi:MAG: heavy-metal-associated domain-containing protein [Thermoplasmata archaeon]